MSPPAIPDKEISAWIMDFVVRRGSSSSNDDDDVVRRLIPHLPHDDEPQLKKRLLRRFMEYEVSNGNVLDNFLDALETIEAIDRCAGLHVKESIMSAYCAVAVDSTLKYLPIQTLNHNNKCFSAAVKRVWTDRIGILEKRKNPLASNYQLNRWKDEIHRALLNRDAANALANINTHHHALKALNAYLKEEEKAQQSLPTTTLLYSAITKCNHMKKKFTPNHNATNNKDNNLRNISSDGPSLPHILEAVKETEEDNVAAANNHNVAPSSTPRDVISKVPQNQGSIDAPDQSEKSPHGNSNVDNKVVEEQGANSNVTSRVNEEAIQEEGHKVAPILRQQTMPVVQEGGGSSTANDFVDAALMEEETVPAQKGDSVATKSGKVTMSPREANKNVLNPSLMERNHTAEAFEWENDELSEEPSTRVHLPSPIRQAVSPLKNYIPKKFNIRRTIKRWKVEEETVLVEAVKRFGKGNWTLILNAYPHVFEGRTAGDLKDKWRNLTRFGRWEELWHGKDNMPPNLTIPEIPKVVCTRIMKDDLCDHVWEFHFTKAVSEYWQNLDSYWNETHPLMRRYFHRDGSQTADPGDKDWGWEMSSGLCSYSSFPDAYKEGVTGSSLALG
ncbi:hypothetical protein ACFE04_025809 [Oxalis oulophora]